MSVNVVRFGPGTFTLGALPGSDFSCQVQSLGVNVDKDEGDAITVLCGDVVPGPITYTYSLAGTVLQDLETANGLAKFSWETGGFESPFTYKPSSGVASITGSVVVDPMSLGTSDGEVGDVLTSDIEWTCVGKPDVTWGNTAAANGARAVDAKPEPQSA